MTRLAALSCGVSPSDRPTVAMAETTSNVTAFRPNGSMAPDGQNGRQAHAEIDEQNGAGLPERFALNGHAEGIDAHAAACRGQRTEHQNGQRRRLVPPAVEPDCRR